MPGMSAVASPPSEGLALAPFRGVRFDPARVSDLAAVTSPPYDVIEPYAVRRLETLDPHNIVRLILPREDAGGPDGRYRHAADLLDQWLAAGVLRRDPVPALYVYEQVTPTTVQRGLVGVLALREPEAGVVLPHEDVMPGPVSDRLALMRATQANLDPILLVYEGGGAASEIVEDTCSARPVLAARTPAGISHRLWTITDPRLHAAIGTDLVSRRAMIADGHHRYAAYRRLQAEHRATGPRNGPWDAGLAMLVDSLRHPLEVRAIHRVLPKLRADEALAALRGHAQVSEVSGGRRGERDASAVAHGLGTLDAGVSSDQRITAVLDERHAGRVDGEFLLIADGREWIIGDLDPSLVAQSMPEDRPPAWRQLDAAILHHVLVDRIWHQPDDPEHVTYHHDATEAVRAAEQTGGLAVILRPPAVETVLELAAAGQRMPRKSTSFGPKPRTGILLRTFAR